jgi:hypothetical protein
MMKILYCFRCRCRPKQNEWYNDRLCINCGPGEIDQTGDPDNDQD